MWRSNIMNCPLKQFPQMNFIQITMKLPDATTTSLPTKSAWAKLEKCKIPLKAWVVAQFGNPKSGYTAWRCKSLEVKKIKKQSLTVWETLKWRPMKNTKIAELQSAHKSRRYMQIWGWTGHIRVSNSFHTDCSFYHQFYWILINAISPRAISWWFHSS